MIDPWFTKSKIQHLDATSKALNCQLRAQQVGPCWTWLKPCGMLGTAFAKDTCGRR